MNGTLQVRTVASASRPVRIALAGCGTVGSALIRLLRERGPAIAREHGLRFENVGVLVRDVRRPRLIESAAGVLTDRLEPFLSRGADVVIEATGAREAALRIARHTLARGACFITANKALIAGHGAELAGLARAHGGRLHFEAAVGGGIPVVRVLRECVRHSGVRAVGGVLNGTSNYVLTRMAEGEDFEAALDAARRQGFAEADASRDLDGRDAADKIAILAWLAFGIDPAAVQVQRTSLLPSPDAYLAAARAEGGVLRQVAECFESEGGIGAVVEPVIVGGTSPLSVVAAEENCVLIDTRRNGTQRLYGPGAGGTPTALSLLSDLLQAATPEPGPRPSGRPARADDRPHAWIASVPGGGVVALLRALDAAGLDVVRITTHGGRVHALTAAAPRERAQACRERLGAGAVVVRCLAGEVQ